MCSNGLTIAENDVLFTSTRPDEIAALVLRGLLRVRRRAATKGPLVIMPYHGSITGSPPVDAYVVPVVPGLPMGGADRAIDQVMEGALQEARRHHEDALQEPASIAVVRTGSGKLGGDWVAMLSLGPKAAAGDSVDARSLGVATATRAIAESWREIATVVMGGNVSQDADISSRVQGFVEGALSVDGSPLETIVFCEWDAPKYDPHVVKACDDVAAKHPERVMVRRLRAEPVPPQQAAVAVILEVERHGNELLTKLIPPRNTPLVPVEPRALDEWVWNALRDPGELRRPDQLADLRSMLSRALLSEDARRELARWPRHPLRIIHDAAASTLPFELFLSSPIPEASGGGPPAFEEGIARSLKLSAAARCRAPVTRTRGTLRVVLVADPTDDLPHARGEVHRLRRELEARGARVVGSPVGKDAKIGAVLGMLRDNRVDALHYSGHASADGLRLSDGMLAPKELDDLAPEAIPPLVVLNACESADLNPSAGDDVSLAQSLLQSGVTCFIGTGWHVPDATAARFGVRFLPEIADGISTGVAFTRTVRDLEREFDAFWFYRLYGDPDLSFS